jgi:hypothetical protein
MAVLDFLLKCDLRIKFSARLPRATNDEDEIDLRASFPTVDILSNLLGIDAVVGDDRPSSKDRFFDDSNRQVPVANTVDLLIALNSRAALSENDKRSRLERARARTDRGCRVNARLAVSRARGGAERRRFLFWEFSWRRRGGGGAMG